MVKPKPVSKSNTNSNTSNSGKRIIPPPQQQNVTNQRTNSADSSVFQNAKQYIKGGSKSYGKPRGRGRGS